MSDVKSKALDDIIIQAAFNAAQYAISERYGDPEARAENLGLSAQDVKDISLQTCKLLPNMIMDTLEAPNLKAAALKKFQKMNIAEAAALIDGPVQNLTSDTWELPELGQS